MVTPATLTTYKLPKSSELEATARRAYQTLSDVGGMYNVALVALSRMLLGPVNGQLGSKRLVVVADGAVHFIPFAALPAPGSGKPLIVEHEVISLPSAFTLAEQRRELAGRRTAPKSVAVLADPVFDSADPRVTGAKQTTKPLQPQLDFLIPEETQRIARAAFPKSCLCLRLADQLGSVFQDQQFATLFPRRGQPAETPARLALATLQRDWDKPGLRGLPLRPILGIASQAWVPAAKSILQISV